MSVRAFVFSITVGAALLAACGGPRRNTVTVAPSPSTPPSEYTAQVDGGLGRLASNARGQGYGRVVSGPVYGRIAEKATATHELDVVNGAEYALVGACDDDCSNMDLRLFDASGAMLMEDVDSDPTPVLTFTARSAGRYRVAVVMAGCGRDPCFYGIELLAK